MIDALMAIVDFIIAIGSFFYNTLASIIWVITSIPSFVGSITALFAYCPTFILAFLEISLALMVLFAIFKLL